MLSPKQVQMLMSRRSGVDGDTPPIHPIHEKKPRRHHMTSLKLAAILSFIGAAVLVGLQVYNNMDDVYRTCTTGQPLVRVYPNFLSGEVFRTLHEEMLRHPLITDNQLDAENFNNSKGWVVKFNHEGLGVLRAKRMFASVLPYVETVLHPEANAFVFNMLLSVQPLQPQKFAVGQHLDDTVAIRPLKGAWVEETFLAHQVDVLYTNLPRDMKGGELEVWTLDWDTTEYGRAMVKPAENMLVEFRGDSLHRVRGFSSPSGQPRISLVLEQYRIPKHNYYRTVEYCENDACGWMETPYA